MLKRTTHYQFGTFGDILYRLPGEIEGSSSFSSLPIPLSEKSFDEIFYSTQPVYLSCDTGIVLLAVSQDGDHYEEFVIHRIVKLKPGVRFNFASISNESSVTMTFVKGSLQTGPAKPYEFHPAVSKLKIKEIFATYYQVRKGDYYFPGEAHPYYELVYIDNGQLEMSVDEKDYSLSKYDLIVYHPGQFHTQKTLPDQNCSYLTIIFDMDDNLPESLINRVFHTRKDIYQVLCRFMKAIQSDEYLDQELAILYLKEVMILLHQFDFKQVQDNSVNPLQQHYDNTLLNEILVYINNNVYLAFTVENLCSKFSISRSSLQNLFRTNLNTSPKQYISTVKLNQAKIMIQQHSKRISEISDLLGFTSIHYFSRKFKAQFGMSPTDYAKSIHS